MSDQLMDINAVMEMVSLRRTMIYSLIASGRFPDPLRLSSRCSRWRLSDIQNWMNELPSNKQHAA